MRTRRQWVAPSGIAGLACMLVTGCAPRAIDPVDGRVAAARRNTPVAVGYATQSPRDLTVAVGSVDFQSAGTPPLARIEDMLAGRVAGLAVLRRADGGFSLRVRGAGSVLGSGEPLLVVDGMPIDVGAVGMLAGLSPRDVQRIDVLKDAGATAIYGIRGGERRRGHHDEAGALNKAGSGGAIARRTGLVAAAAETRGARRFHGQGGVAVPDAPLARLREALYPLP